MTKHKEKVGSMNGSATNCQRCFLLKKLDMLSTLNESVSERFSAKHCSLRRTSKDGLARNQDIMSEWSDMFTWRLLF
jgi:hypothetical protein